MVEVQDLTKSFANSALFKNVTVTFPKAELSVIMGPSGCGKTTFLRCLNFLEPFDSGMIRVGDLSLRLGEGSKSVHDAETQDRIRRLRLRTGMVFQSFNLFPHLTVLGNVTLAPTVVKGMPEAAARDLASSILDRVGLGQMKDVYPSRLSGGQQQRVAIARSLAMQPEVMLYDEPTSALDPRLVDEVFDVMRELNKEGMTQIIVTHDTRFAREVTSRVLFFEAGGAMWRPSSEIHE